eukprot:tig00000691_g3159.t1
MCLALVVGIGNMGGLAALRAAWRKSPPWATILLALRLPVQILQALALFVMQSKGSAGAAVTTTACNALFGLQLVASSLWASCLFSWDASLIAAGFAALYILTAMGCTLIFAATSPLAAVLMMPTPIWAAMACCANAVLLNLGPPPTHEEKQEVEKAIRTKKQK